MSALMLREQTIESAVTRRRGFIPVAETVLDGNEKKYVLDCLDTGWISGSGKYVDDFEREFAAFCGVEHAVSVSNGTAGLHVALLALGIGAGDEVIVPDLTYVASANAVTYCGAKPVLADVDASTWTLDPQDVARKISPATKAILPVHLYGHPADLDPILELARAHNLYVVEDAAEAHGAEYKGRRVGGLCDVGVFSFFGNKIITTGEGGMITTNDKVLADKVRLLKGQGMDTARRYWFPIVGYNYRMTNIQAAIGLAQLERIEWFIEKKRDIAALYDEAMRSLPLITPYEAVWARSVYWLYSVCLPEEFDRDQIMARLLEQGIETRPFFHPMHHLPPYHQHDGDSAFPITTNLAARGINLPSSALLTRDDIAYITGALRACLH
jgi:perosamine synthetase